MYLRGLLSCPDLVHQDRCAAQVSLIRPQVTCVTELIPASRPELVSRGVRRRLNNGIQSRRINQAALSIVWHPDSSAQLASFNSEEINLALV